MGWKIYILTLKFRLIVFGLFLIGLGTALRLFLALPIIQEQIGELVSSQQMAIASYVAQDIDDKISARLTLIGKLAAAVPPQLIAKPSALSEWLRERQQLSPLFNSGLMVVRLNG